MNSLDNENGAMKTGADALIMDHGYFNFVNIPEFSAAKFSSVHAAHKKRIVTTNQSDLSPKAGETSAGGELASE